MYRYIFLHLVIFKTFSNTLFSGIEHLDFMSQSDLPDSCETHFSQIHHEYIGYQSLTDVPKAHTYKEEKISCAVSTYNNLYLQIKIYKKIF